VKAFGARPVSVALQWGSVVWLVALWILVAAGVLVRFLSLGSMAWADEIVELAFAWMVFTGAAALWGEGTHFCVDLVLLRLGDSAAGRALRILLAALSLAFLLVFTYYGAILTVNATDSSPILEYPRRLTYVIMPLAGALMIGYTLRDLRRMLRTPADTRRR
jgi:TRAP-type C4-dicarboxylate transport system permease small subunit